MALCNLTLLMFCLLLEIWCRFQFSHSRLASWNTSYHNLQNADRDTVKMSTISACCAHSVAHKHCMMRVETRAWRPSCEDKLYVTGTICFWTHPTFWIITTTPSQSESFDGLGDTCQKSISRSRMDTIPSNGGRILKHGRKWHARRQTYIHQEYNSHTHTDIHDIHTHTNRPTGPPISLLFRHPRPARVCVCR